jgi:hypothetical protein
MQIMNIAHLTLIVSELWQDIQKEQILVKWEIYWSQKSYKPYEQKYWECKLWSTYRSSYSIKTLKKRRSLQKLSGFYPR